MIVNKIGGLGKENACLKTPAVISDRHFSRKRSKSARQKQNTGGNPKNGGLP